MKSTKIELEKALQNNQEALISMTQELIRRPSIYKGEAEAQEFFATKLHELGADVDCFEPDIELMCTHPGFTTDRENFCGSPVISACFKGSGGGRSLILSGHMDVVPTGKGDWSVEPYGGELKDGKIYGRGAADMKGGIAANYIAVKSILDAGIRLKGDVLIQTTIDEECGSAGVLALIMKGFTADACIETEPTSLDLDVACVAGMFFKITVEGKSAHGGLAYNGVNSIYKAIKIVEAIRELEEERRLRLMNTLYANIPTPFCLGINKFVAGDWPGIVPAKCIIEGRIGASPDEAIEQVMTELEERIMSISKADTWMKTHLPTIEYYNSRWNSGSIPVEHPIVQILAANGKEILGRELHVKGMSASSDSGTYIRFGNIPTVNFGAFSMDMAHQTDEYVDVQSLMHATRIIAHTIVDFCEIEN